MFTGLIEATGSVLSVTPTAGATRMVIAAPALAGKWRTGDSIAVNGVCLTALAVEESIPAVPGTFAADLATETVERTSLAQLPPGTLVNLELPTPAGAPLGGHLVQGHVDATGTLVSLVPLHPDSDITDWRMTIEVPPSVLPSIVPQGSITVDGISLTVAHIDGRRLEIAIIPHTYKSTNLRSLLAGAAVNLEADVLAKYAAQRGTSSLTPSAPNSASRVESLSSLTVAYLLANGY